VERILKKLNDLKNFNNLLVILWLMDEEPTQKLSKLKRTKLLKGTLRIIFVVTFLGIAGFAGWSFYSYQKAQEEVLRLSTLEGQEEIRKQDLENLLSRVRAHMILPEDEEPTVATITNIEALIEDQPFFEGANDGDKVLVYVGARKAIIYSPERDLVINVGAVVVDNQQVALDETDEEFARLDIELRNGTSAAGLARDVSSRLSGENDAFNFVNLTDAAKRDYGETLVINMGRTSNSELINSLAQVLGASVVNSVPEGEQGSSAEVLILVGEDQVKSEAEVESTPAPTEENDEEE